MRKLIVASMVILMISMCITTAEASILSSIIDMFDDVKGNYFDVTRSNEVWQDKIKATKDKYDGFNFRMAAWGMNKEEIGFIEQYMESNLRYESKQVRNQPTFSPDIAFDYLYQYNIGDVNGYDMNLKYFFNEDHLIASAYVLNEDYDNLNRYISIYKYYQKILSNKFGEPTTNKVIWRDDYTKKVYKDNGKAVQWGFVRYITKYDIPESRIILRLYSKDDKMILVIFYKSQKYLVDNVIVDYNNF